MMPIDCSSHIGGAISNPHLNLRKVRHGSMGGCNLNTTGLAPKNIIAWAHVLPETSGELNSSLHKTGIETEGLVANPV